MNQIDLPDLTAFIAAARDRGIAKVALRVVRETRPVRGEGTAIVVGPQRWVDVTGYRAGVVLFVRVNDADGDAVEATLTSAGFAVQTTSDNIT